MEEGLVRTEVICTSGKCFVLILIVVEDGLVLNYNSSFVLILIVVEDGLVQDPDTVMSQQIACLNPYCSGRWSRTYCDR